MALFHYYDTSTVQNRHQLLTCQTSKWQSLLSKTTIIFEFFIKNLTEMQYLSVFALKIFGRFTQHSLEKLGPRSLALASTISVIGIERVCPRKVGPWTWPRIFLNPCPWPRTLFPRLHLSSNQTKWCSVARGAGCCPPIGLKSMQNTTFLHFWGRFLLKKRK